jgi:catechol 2,3-dioxygenase-like lactoylglutathione lyase family enzyme
MSEVSIRYIVADVDTAIEFYTKQLGFQLDLHPAPGFACLARGELRLLLNRPGAGGAGQAMPDGRAPAPGGWNRIQLEVTDLVGTVEKLKADGCRFRGEIVTGNGGRQILVDDPSGNPIELFEAFRPDVPAPARRASGESTPAR